MSLPPIIQASLVDARNVGTDKEIKLELRIPAEAATRFLEVFGWPTRANPVPVAVVPVQTVVDVVMEATIDVAEPTLEPVSGDAFKRKSVEILDEAIDKLEKVKDRTAFTKLPRVKQAGIRCNEPAFWTYLNKRFPDMDPLVHDKDTAANAVRHWCLVESRRELDEKPGCGVLWDNLENGFWLKQHGME